MSLADDPRWQRLHDPDYVCSWSGRRFDGVMDIGCDHPDPWPHGNRAAAGVETLREGDDLLSADLCIVGGEHFIRALLPVPIEDTPKVFTFGAWAHVDALTFGRYLKAETGGPPFERAEAAVANALPGWIDAPVTGDLVVVDPESRPVLLISDETHPFGAAQRKGIAFDDVLDLYALVGDDIRPHLEG